MEMQGFSRSGNAIDRGQPERRSPVQHRLHGHPGFLNTGLHTPEMPGKIEMG